VDQSGAGSNPVVHPPEGYGVTGSVPGFYPGGLGSVPSGPTSHHIIGKEVQMLTTVLVVLAIVALVLFIVGHR
jgi:hypothetical protein